MESSILDQQGWINSRAVRDRLTAAAEKGSAPNQLWYVFVLESWLRREQEQNFGVQSAQYVSDTEGAAAPR
jgi:hypothetical protein